MTSKKSAWTLVEVLVVVVIASVLAGILTPVLLRARHAAHISVSVSNLRQLHVALSLYRTEHGGDGIYGDIDVMGLPNVALLRFPEYFGFPDKIQQSGCGVHPSEVPHNLSIWYYPGEGRPEFARRASLYRQNLILFYDMQCTDPDVSIHNNYATRLGLGVLVEGQLVRVLKKGDWSEPGWWSDPPQ